jgi:CRISPR system Cascade subunit CasE
MHATLCRAFVSPETRCPPNAILWRLEAERERAQSPRMLVQSDLPADWSRIGIGDWMVSHDAPLDLMAAGRLGLRQLSSGKHFRFRLRANPSVTRDKRRQGLLQLPDQERWLARKGAHHGFALPPAPGGDHGERFDVRVSEERMLRGRQHGGNAIRVFSVLYDGVLTVTDADAFLAALRSGIGHGKALGLGLLSVAPLA